MADMEEIKRDWYFTFCYDSPHAKCYLVISNATWAEARDKVMARFGTKWAFQYETADLAGVDEYGLTRIE